MPVSYGSETAITVTGWASLAAAARGASAAVDNSTNLFHAADLEVTLDTGGTAPGAGSFWELWLEPSTDAGTTFGEDGGVLLAAIEQPTAINTTKRVTLSTDTVLAVLPRNWRLAIVNRGTQTMGADVECQMRGKKAA